MNSTVSNQTNIFNVFPEDQWVQIQYGKFGKWQRSNEQDDYVHLHLVEVWSDHNITENTLTIKNDRIHVKNTLNNSKEIDGKLNVGFQWEQEGFISTDKETEELVLLHLCIEFGRKTQDRHWASNEGIQRILNDLGIYETVTF